MDLLWRLQIDNHSDVIYLWQKKEVLFYTWVYLSLYVIFLTFIWLFLIQFCVNNFPESEELESNSGSSAEVMLILNFLFSD